MVQQCRILTACAAACMEACGIQGLHLSHVSQTGSFNLVPMIFLCPVISLVPVTLHIHPPCTLPFNRLTLYIPYVIYIPCCPGVCLFVDLLDANPRQSKSLLRT